MLALKLVGMVFIQRREDAKIQLLSSMEKLVSNKTLDLLPNLKLAEITIVPVRFALLPMNKTLRQDFMATSKHDLEFTKLQTSFQP